MDGLVSSAIPRLKLYLNILVEGVVKYSYYRYRYNSLLFIYMRIYYILGIQVVVITYILNLVIIFNGVTDPFKQSKFLVNFGLQVPIWLLNWEHNQLKEQLRTRGPHRLSYIYRIFVKKVIQIDNICRNYAEIGTSHPPDCIQDPWLYSKAIAKVRREK